MTLEWEYLITTDFIDCFCLFWEEGRVGSAVYQLVCEVSQLVWDISALEGWLLAEY